MQDIPITMIHHDISLIPSFKLPRGYTTRNFTDSDQAIWAAIETAAGEFDTIENALERFDKEFSPYIDKFTQRSLFLLNDQQECIGTGTAWYNDYFRGERYGRLHRLGINPDYQGKGLANPFISQVIGVLSGFHTKAYLNTQTSSYKAVKIYLDSDFKPLIENYNDTKVWEIVVNKLK